MNELEKGAQVVEPNGKAIPSAAYLGEEGFGPEGERERTIAKAALSVAELSTLTIISVNVFIIMKDIRFTLRSGDSKIIR